MISTSILRFPVYTFFPPVLTSANSKLHKHKHMQSCHEKLGIRTTPRLLDFRSLLRLGLFCFCFFEKYRIQKTSNVLEAPAAVFGILFLNSKDEEVSCTLNFPYKDAYFTSKQKDIDFHANVQLQINELRSLFHASVLLLTMHFVIALKK